VEGIGITYRQVRGIFLVCDDPRKARDGLAEEDSEVSEEKRLS